MRRPYRSSGFTLIELMITLAIAAILLGLAVPAFNQFLLSNRAEVQSSTLINSLGLARSEAVRRGQSVFVTALGAGGWQNGWRVWVDRNGDGAFDAANDDELQIQPAYTTDATLTAGGVIQVVFNRLGGVEGIDPGLSTTFAYRMGGDHCKLERDITINHLGRATVARRNCS